VLPPHNRTDDPLLIASESYWDPVARRSRPVTVADALAAEARAQLEQHGFSVVSPEHVEKVIGTHPPGSPQEAAELAAQGQLSGSLLYIDILRWEPDLRIRPERILVALQVSLIDAATGQVIWTDHHALHPVPTRGAINLWNAYLIAAHDVVAITVPFQCDTMIRVSQPRGSLSSVDTRVQDCQQRRRRHLP
jgi:hypothetical protein